MLSFPVCDVFLCTWLNVSLNSWPFWYSSQTWPFFFCAWLNPCDLFYILSLFDFSFHMRLEIYHFFICILPLCDFFFMCDFLGVDLKSFCGFIISCSVWLYNLPLCVNSLFLGDFVYVIVISNSMWLITFLVWFLLSLCDSVYGADFFMWLIYLFVTIFSFLFDSLCDFFFYLRVTFFYLFMWLSFLFVWLFFISVCEFFFFFSVWLFLSVTFFCLCVTFLSLCVTFFISTFFSPWLFFLSSCEFVYATIFFL